jgi:hypothetical protein
MGEERVFSEQTRDPRSHQPALLAPHGYFAGAHSEHDLVKPNPPAGSSTLCVLNMFFRLFRSPTIAPSVSPDRPHSL